MKHAKKWISMVLVAVCLAGILSGCTNANTPETRKTRTVVDMSGHSVEVPEKVDSYISLWVGSVTITMMFDHGTNMVGCSETAASYPMFDRACQNTKDITYFTNDAVTLEGILETGAEVVFYRGKDNADLAENLIKAGIAAVDVEFNTYDEMLDAIDIMADVLNTDHAREIASKYRTYANETIGKAQKIGDTVQDKKSVIVIRDTSNLRAYGVNRFAGRWATLCGGDYALKEGDPNGYVNLTSEQLMEYDPDFIIFVIPGEAKKFAEDLSSFTRDDPFGCAFKDEIAFFMLSKSMRLCASAIVRTNLSCDLRTRLVKAIYAFFSDHFPGWRRNPYYIEDVIRRSRRHRPPQYSYSGGKRVLPLYCNYSERHCLILIKLSCILPDPLFGAVLKADQGLFRFFRRIRWGLS